MVLQRAVLSTGPLLWGGALCSSSHCSFHELLCQLSLSPLPTNSSLFSTGRKTCRRGQNIAAYSLLETEEVYSLVCRASVKKTICKERLRERGWVPGRHVQGEVILQGSSRPSASAPHCLLAPRNGLSFNSTHVKL